MTGVEKLQPGKYIQERNDNTSNTHKSNMACTVQIYETN